MQTTINEINIPSELKERQQWVLWRIEHGDRKVPFQTNGAYAKSNDPTTWDTFETAFHRYAAGNWDGLGFVFAADDPYVGIDLDGCRNPETGEYAQWAREIICQLSTYAEISPSRSGVKLWVRGEWPYSHGNKVEIQGVESIVDKTPAIEIYGSVRYFTVTGWRLRGQEVIAERQDQLKELRSRFWKQDVVASPRGDFRSRDSVVDRARKYLAKLPPAISGQDGSGATFHAACVLVIDFDLPVEDALNLLMEWNVNCQPPWSERELRHKVEDANRRSDHRGRLRNASPQNYDRIPMTHYQAPPPVESSSEPEPEAKPVSTVRVTTMQAAAKKYLHAVSSGSIQLLRLGLPEIDSAIGGGVESGEMIIFAGRPSHGKSAVSQQVAHYFTANGIPVAFFSEEMSALALGKRVISFVSSTPNEHWATSSDAVTGDIDSHFSERAPCYIIEGCRRADIVASQIREFVKEKNIGLAIVDYAQLLQASGKGRYEQVTNVSIILKQVAAECNIPVIVLCQMSRSIESRDKFIPVMSDLKESGQFEQDADVIIFQVWPHRINSEKPPEEYQMFVAKNRNRPVNSPIVNCRFLPSRQMLVYEKTQFNLPDASVCDEFDQIGDGADATGLDLHFGP